jgi:hypothetical protein
MSLGCGPQAGNITSDNITYKHLLNIKRAAFLRRDWQEIEARDHATAARFTRDSAPRGSGLPGDPALSLGAPLASSSAFSAGAASNWQGNAPLVQAAPKAPSASPGASSVPMSFVHPARAEPKVHAAPKSPAGASAPALVPGSGGGAGHQGARLTTAEIQNIMAHAGAGCPLGPCKGCAHQEVSTQACLA